VTGSIAISNGAVISGAACFPLWQLIDAELRRRKHASGGARLRPEILEAVQALREAGLGYTSANGQPGRTSEDIPSHSESRVPNTTTTAAFAGALGVSDRHARRIAQEYGITPIARGIWANNDVNYVVARRGRTGE